MFSDMVFSLFLKILYLIPLKDQFIMNSLNLKEKKNAVNITKMYATIITTKPMRGFIVAIIFSFRCDKIYTVF